MFARYKTDAPLTAGNALYLAERLGAEHVSDNRVVFNLISNQLFGGYDEAIRQPIDNNWRRMPALPQLLEAAESGFRRARTPFDELRFERLRISLTSKAREVFYSAVPKLDGLVADPHLIIGQRVVTELMAQRHRAVVDAGRQNKGIIGNILADRNAEAIHANYLKEVSNGDLTTAFSNVAHGIANEAVADVYDEETAVEMLSDAESLVTAARALGGTIDADVWKRLSATQALIMENQFPAPRAKLSASTASGNFAP
jgi:hypothetical protein